MCLKIIKDVLVIQLSLIQIFYTLLGDAGAGILQAPFLFCQQLSVRFTTREHKRKQESWRREKDLLLLVLLAIAVGISPALVLNLAESIDSSSRSWFPVAVFSITRTRGIKLSQVYQHQQMPLLQKTQFQWCGAPLPSFLLSLHPLSFSPLLLPFS